MSVKLKKLIDNQISNLILESKQTKDYIDAIKNNNNLNTYWTIIDNLQNGKTTAEFSEKFISENIDMMKEVDLQLINEIASKFENPVLDELDSAINTLLFEKKTPKNIQKFADAYVLVKENLEGNLNHEIKMLQLEESLKKINSNELTKRYLESDREEFFNSIRQESIEYINECLKDNNDQQTKLLLYETKEKLSAMTIEDENFISQILEVRSLMEE